MDFNKFTRQELITFLGVHGIELPDVHKRKKPELVEACNALINEINSIPEKKHGLQ